MEYALMTRSDAKDLYRQPSPEVDRKRLYGPIVTDTPGVWARVWKALGGKL